MCRPSELSSHTSDEYADPRAGLEWSYMKEDVYGQMKGKNLTPAQAILMEGHAQAVNQGSFKMLRMYLHIPSQ